MRVKGPKGKAEEKEKGETKEKQLAGDEKERNWEGTREKERAVGNSVTRKGKGENTCHCPY